MSVLCGLLAVTGLMASFGGAALARPVIAPSTSAACIGSRDLALRNGKIVTMGTPAVVSQVVIRDGRIAHVGPGGRSSYTACTRTLDLKGRTAIPGLIDGHIHFVTWGFRPGRDVRLDRAETVADVARIISERAAGLPGEEWITAVGGWSRSQLRDNRLPTRAELDQASQALPVFVWEREGLPAATNSIGARFFEARGIAVSADGVIAAGREAAVAYSLLGRSQVNPERGTLEAMAYLASLGITVVSDMGVNAAPEGQRPAERSWHSGHVDVYRAYDPLLALWRAGRLTVRVRLNFLDTPDGPAHDAERLKYQFPNFGNDMLKTLCMGEFITPDPAKYADSALAVARRGGWCHEQHVMGLADIRKFVGVWEGVNAEASLAGRHWRLGHVFGIDGDALSRLRALDAGVTVATMLYAQANPLPGPSREIPYRTIVNSGVPVGAVSDGPNYMPVDPWIHISLIVTGKDSQGRQVVKPGETLDRMQALRLYTANQAWFMDDDRLGSITQGAFGDIVVLDRDYLTVPEEQIRAIRADLTIVGGQVAYDGAATRQF
ncbi:MAG TPA: amidohydrolase family protein [Novosphingobium sp.]|nr:amidohydrolase family protein [Novosphingobium sp.]